MPSKDRRAGATERTIWLAASTEEHRVCIRCRVEQPLAQFSVRGSRRELTCRKCRAQRQSEYRASLSTERRIRDRHAMRGWRFGLSPDAVVAILAEQKGRCAICATELTSGRRGPERACLDHDHRTGTPRAFLCASCNSKLGQFEAVQSFSEAFKEALVDYLARYSSEAPGRRP
jgi:hypothetical protein